MDLNKFTERARGFVQAAQTIAMREGHQKLSPEHILKALMDDDQGLASNLIKRAGGAPERVAEAVDAAIGKIPKVTGDAGQTYLDQSTARVLDEAEKVATAAGDSFNAAYLWARLSGAPAADAIKAGQAVATQVIMRPGAVVDVVPPVLATTACKEPSR